MEFSRRGPVTGDDHRFPDPPPHGSGEQEPMLVMRDAVLSQLHMACLRREIVEAELAKIERAVALRAATGGLQTQTTPMADADAGQSQQWPLSTNQPMAQQNAEFDEHKLPDSNKDPLLSQLHMAQLRREIIEAELAEIERAMALCAATGGGHQAQTTPMPMPMPWHGVAAADAGLLKPSPFNAEQPMAQQNNAEFDEHKLPDSDKAVPPSKASPAEKCEITGMTVPVMKPKPPMKWNCTVCQVQATSEQNLQQHYDGQKHLSNVAALDPATKASDQKAKSAAEHSLGTEQKKTSSITWSCSTCQAKGTSQSTLEAHLKGKRHQQNIEATCVEGNMDGMPKNAAAQEAKSHGISVPKNSDKPWPFIAEQPMAQEFDEHNKLPDSNKVQAISEQDLQQHYAGQKHLSNVATLDPTTKESDQNMKTVAAPSLSTEQKKMSPIKWSCSTCQAKGTSQSTLEAHLKGKRHQQNIAATCVEGNMDGMPKNIAAQEAKSHGIIVPKNSDKPWPFIAEKTMAQEFDEHKLLNSNKVQAISEQDLQQHYAGQKHLSNVATPDPTTKESDQNMKTVAEPSLRTEQKKMSPIKWSCSACQANGTSQSTLDSHLKGRRHQQNIAATSVEGDKNGIPSHGINLPTHLEKPPSAWSCSICQVICTCQTDLKNHLMGIRHREKVQSLLEQSKNKASDSDESRKAKLNPDSRWICRICHAPCTCESDLEKHFAGKRHQLNIQVLIEKIKQEKINPLQTAKKQEPPLAWNCTMCEAKCNSKSQFENHCGSSRHQQKMQAVLGEGKIVKAISSRAANELRLDGSNGKNASLEMAEKQPSLYFCEVCSLLFESSTMLVHHRFGKKHRAKLGAKN